MELTEEDIKKRWQEYTEVYEKDPHDTDNHYGVTIQLEPDILECEVMWALGSTTIDKVSGGCGIPVALFLILNDDGVKVLHSVRQQIWKTQQWPEDWKSNADSSPSQASTVHDHEIPDVQARFTKGRGLRDQIATSVGSSKARELQKTSISSLLTMLKPMTVWITTNCGKIFKRWEYQTT